jgi:aldehyde:ferredoxin oxidoreductase
MTDYFETKILTRDDINQILDDYYRERGWDLKTGVPKKEKIMHLGLQDFVSRSFMDSSGGDTLIV